MSRSDFCTSNCSRLLRMISVYCRCCAPRVQGHTKIKYRSSSEYAIHTHIKKGKTQTLSRIDYANSTTALPPTKNRKRISLGDHPQPRQPRPTKVPRRTVRARSNGWNRQVFYFSSNSRIFPNFSIFTVLPVLPALYILSILSIPPVSPVIDRHGRYVGRGRRRSEERA